MWRRFLFAALATALLPVVSACSDEETSLPTGGRGGGGAGGGTGGTGGTGGSTYTGPCVPLTLGDTSVYFDSVARGAIVPVTPPLSGVAKTRLTMELYEDDGTGTLPPLATGTFPFATPPDDNYGRCQHCALLVGFDKTGQPLRAFYPKDGTLTLDAFSPDDWTVFKGRIDGAELYEVTQNPDLSWEFLPGDACYYVESWPFDTRPIDGGSCQSAEQCPNEGAQVCSPRTGTCAPPECNLLGDPPFCDAGEVCLSQLFDPDATPSGPALGACYATCTPGEDGSCGAGAVCRALGPTQGFGVCMQAGTAMVGDACTPRDNSTECAPGAVCWGEPGECEKTCAYLTEVAACPDDRFCTISNLCKPASAGDAAKIDATCAADSPELAECGVEGDAFRGICMKFFLEETSLTCERLCRTAAPACPEGQSCLGVFSNVEVGVCHKTPVCGDGELDVVGGELCDDGNTAPGDACSPDCTAADFQFLCGQAAPLLLGTMLPGDTSNGPSGYSTDCDPYVATRTATFSYTPQAPGRLTLELSAAADLGVSVLGDCADPGSHLACAGAKGTTHLELDVAAVPAKPLLVVVRGQTPLQEGPFLLVATYEEAVCGDGKVLGPEACDDGNTTAGDGCSADCLAVEWPEVCAGLPLLPTGPLDGTTIGGPPIYALDGICAYAPEDSRAFRFVAPSDGELHLVLDEKGGNLVVYVQDGCGPVTGNDYLACANSSFDGGTETTTATLAKDQLVTVIVAGFSSPGGPFTLSSTFTPAP